MVHVVEVNVPASPSLTSRPESKSSPQSSKSPEIAPLHQTPNSAPFEPVPLTSPKPRPSVVTLPGAFRRTPPSVPRPTATTPQCNKRKKSLASF